MACSAIGLMLDGSISNAESVSAFRLTRSGQQVERQKSCKRSETCQNEQHSIRHFRKVFSIRAGGSSRGEPAQSISRS
jgi:hypothetical protein